MTPFVDVGFLILFFFIMATKFKPPEPLTITTPHSVSASKLKEQDAILVQFDSSGHVYFTLNAKKSQDVTDLRQNLIQNVNTTRNLGLTPTEMKNFVKDGTVGSPFAQLKQYLSMSDDQRKKAKQSGIPVDTTNNELQFWIANAVNTFSGHTVNFMIKGDNGAKYPTFKGVMDALRKNDQYKYQLITDPKGVPVGTDLYAIRSTGKKEAGAD
jgi:biopolymer transport protein ExbD